MALHVTAYVGPDEKKYVQRSSHGLYYNQEHRSILQNLITHKNNFIYRVEKNAIHKNLRINKALPFGNYSNVITKVNDDVKFYDLKDGDIRGKYIKELSLNLLPTSIAKIPVYVNERPLQAIIDTGANISFISTKEAKLLRIPIHTNNTSGTVTAYGGMRLDIVGQVEVKIKLSVDIIYRCKLQVMKSNQIHLLFGCDFI